MKKICLVGMLIITFLFGCNMSVEETEIANTKVSENMIDMEEDKVDTDMLPDGSSAVPEETAAPLYEGDQLLWSNHRIIGIREDGMPVEIYQGGISDSVVVSGNGTLFFYKAYTTGGAWSGDGEPYREHTQVIALPFDGREPYILLEFDDVRTLYLDYYKDMLCVATQSSETEGFEWYYKENEDGVYEIISGETPFDFSQAQQLGYSRFAGANDSGELVLVLSKPSECNGNVILWNEEEQTAGIFESDGNLLYTFSDMESVYDLRLLNERYLLEQMEEGVYLHDLKTQTETKITDGADIFRVTLQDNLIYYKTSEQINPYQFRFSDNMVTYYCYNIDTGETTELVKTEMPYDTDYPYYIYDGILYYVDYEQDGLIEKWMKCDLTTEEPAVEELGVIERQGGFPKYGSLKSDWLYTLCPECGEVVWFARKDTFCFFDSISSAEKMNEILADYAEAYVSQTDGNGNLQWHTCEDLCWHYNSWKLNDVVEIGDRYFSLAYSSYEDQQTYTHGIEGQVFFLMDTMTGENVTIENLYEGTEEELKQIVAEQAVTIYQNTGSSRWPVDGEEEVYYDIYDLTYFGQDIQFCENGVKFFYDTAYAVGSYFAVLVPYEKLGLDYLYGN